jgi:2-(1,2-epoxy-1,2-dihydrophenyl)acetyl-CoA isomerase
MTLPTLLQDQRDGILTLTLNRPDKLNAVDADLAQSLLQALQRAAADATVRVVVLRGQGRAFCAGRDVSRPPTDQDLVDVQAVSQVLVGMPQPVVAAVQGWTVGAGLEWMLDADVVIASSDARFKLPEASIGVFVTGGITATLPACAGLARAKALMLLGETFTAAEAQAWGLVWRLVEPSALDDEVARVAGALAALRPEVVSRFKRVLNDVGLASFSRAVALECDAQRSLA